jgi:hypothetical protein
MERHPRLPRPVRLGRLCVHLVTNLPLILRGWTHQHKTHEMRCATQNAGGFSALRPAGANPALHFFTMSSK